MIAVESWSSAKTFTRKNLVQARACESIAEINGLKWNTLPEEVCL